MSKQVGGMTLGLLGDVQGVMMYHGKSRHGKLVKQ